MKIEIYTDGGCEPNPGHGAYGYCLTVDNKLIHEHSKYVPNSTNNQMELSAVISALEYCAQNHKKDEIHIFSDSRYVVDGITSWSHKWRRKGWMIKKNKVVKNKDLWVRLYSLTYFEGLQVHYRWVRGHNGNVWNEYADSLCEMLIQKYYGK